VTVQVFKAPDRRVARTQKLLRDALHSLIRERDYDSIAVKEILDRANVGRSAFYTHFRDKDELLASSIYDLLGTIPSSHPKTGDGCNEGFFGSVCPFSNTMIGTARLESSCWGRGGEPSFITSSKRYLLN